MKCKKASDTKIFRIFRITSSFIVTFIVYYARTAQRSFVDRALPFCAHSCDHWIKMIAFIALALHWFNPLVWIAYLMLCKDIEIACDERVVQFMELGERKAYASALLQCSTNQVY